jgi:hypothetical protein
MRQELASHHTTSAPGELPPAGVEVISGSWGVGSLSRCWLRLRLARVGVG